MAAEALPEYSAVRIVRLHRHGRQFQGTEGVCRAPQVGDTGTIVHVYNPIDPATEYIVESVDQDGHTIWLADFAAAELELLDRHSHE